MTAPKPIANVSQKLSIKIDGLMLDLLGEAKKSSDTTTKLQVVDRAMKWYGLKEKLGTGDDDAGSVLDGYANAARATPVNNPHEEPNARRTAGSPGSSLPYFGTNGAGSAEEGSGSAEEAG